MDTTIQGPGPCQPPDDGCEGNSSNPIRYFNGRLLFEEVDLDAGLYGFRHSRMFLNRTFDLTPWDSVQGWNWAVEEWPYLVRRVNEYAPSEEIENIVLKKGLMPLWFNKQGDGSFVARYGNDARHKLEHLEGDGIYRYTRITDGSSEIIDFHDFAQTEDIAGMMKRRVDDRGYETVAAGYGDKCITALETLREDVVFRLRYNYHSGGFWDGKLSSVELESELDSEITPIRRVEYLYHDGTTNEGPNGCLKAAITQQPKPDTDPMEWEGISLRYYRYVQQSRPLGGENFLLSVVVGPTVYMKLKEFGQDVLTMTQSSSGPDLVPEFANHVFTYDNVCRVIREVARGTNQSTSSEGVTYVRERNPNVPRNQRTPTTAADYNTWTWKITEEGFGGYRQIVYTNKIGQPLATVKQALDDPARQWIDANHRDDGGRVILRATPAAVARIDESLPDLIGHRSDGSFAHLRSHEGLITHTEYSSATTATSTTPGEVQGYFKSIFIQEGWEGGLIPQRFVNYLASDNTTGAVTYVPAEEVVFRDDEDTPESRITTSHAYTWYEPVGDKPARIKERVTTLPIVPVDQGGDGLAHTAREFFDERRNKTYEMDPRGIITHREYDVVRDWLLRETRDAVSAPPGWTVLPPPHLVSATDFSYDVLGRLVRTMGPEHNALVEGSAADISRCVYTCRIDTPLDTQPLFGQPAWDQVRTAVGYRTVSPETEEIVSPVQIELLDKCGRTVHTIVSMRSTGTGPLSPSDTFLRSHWSRWQTNGYERRGLRSSERVYHDIPAASSGLEGVFENIGLEGVNYDERQFGYAVDSPLLVRQRDPEGTVTRFLYDEIDRLAAQYIGTQDVPTVSRGKRGSRRRRGPISFLFQLSNMTREEVEGIPFPPSSSDMWMPGKCGLPATRMIFATEGRSSTARNPAMSG